MWEPVSIPLQGSTIVEALAGFYLPEGFKDVAAYVILLVVLIVRPQGLFGTIARKKV